MLRKYTEWLLRFPLLFIALSLGMVMAAGFGAKYLSFKSDYRMFFSEENPQLINFEALQKTFSRDDNILIVLTPKNGDVFTAKNLAIAEELTKKLWQTPHSTRVDSITNFQNSTAVGDDLVVEELVTGASKLTKNQIARIKDIALKEPLLASRLVSKDAKVMGFNVTVQRPGKDQNAETKAAVEYARKLINEIRATAPEMTVHLTGSVVMDGAFAEGSEQDLKTLTPSMLLIIAVGLWWFLRSFLGMLSAVSMMFLSIIGAVGMAGWLGISFSPSSIPAPTILLTLAVADSVHILATFYGGLAHGLDKRTAVQESLRINFKAIFFTNLTTAIGFLSMNFSDAPPFHDLGNITAMGVVVAYILTISFLPALLVLLPAAKGRAEVAGSKTLDALATFIINNNKKLLIGLSLLTLGLVACIPLNKIDDEFVKYFDKSVEFRSDTDYVSENLTGIYNIEYALDQGTPGGINEPEFLAQVEAFVGWYRQQPETIHVYAINDILKRLNKNMHGDDPEFYRLPETREMAAQYLLLYEMSLPYGLDLNNRVNVSKSATRVTVTLRNLSSQQSIALEARAQAWLKHNALLLYKPLAPLKHSEGTSPTLLFAYIGQRNILSMITGEMMSIAVISMILIFVLQSFGLGFLSLVPNLVPAGMAFGIWGLTVGQVGMASSVVAAMTLGILVDDTVHFLSKYQYARKDKDLSPEDALHYAFSTVGNALWTTSAVLILGFSLFTLSSFRINFEMGLLVSIIFALGLFAEFLLLPPILLAYEGFMARMALNPPRFVEQVMSSWDGLCQLLPSTSVPAQPVATGSTYERRTSSAASTSHQPWTSDRTYGRQSETAKASHKRRATDRKYGRNQDFVKSGEGRRASDGKYEKYTDFKIEYHFIWATQARHKVLVGAIATRLRELIKHACDTLDAQVIKGTVNKDYVHIIVSAPPIVTPEDIVQRIKNRTALKLFEEYPALRECATAERFWARGYFCATVGKITERMVNDYLEQHGSGIDKGVNLAKTGTEQ